VPFAGPIPFPYYMHNICIFKSCFFVAPNASITGGWNGAKRSVSRPALQARSSLIC
jgi:hypothetical protein